MRAAISLRHVEPGGVIASIPGSACGVFIMLFAPGGPTAAIMCGGRARSAATWSRSPSRVSHSARPMPSDGRVISPSANATCETAAERASPDGDPCGLYPLERTGIGTRRSPVLKLTTDVQQLARLTVAVAEVAVIE